MDDEALEQPAEMRIGGWTWKQWKEIHGPALGVPTDKWHALIAAAMTATHEVQELRAVSDDMTRALGETHKQLESARQIIREAIVYVREARDEWSHRAPDGSTEADELLERMRAAAGEAERG